MADTAHHEGGAQRPVAVVVEAPRDLHSFHGCPALLARGGRAGDQFGSVHELIFSSMFTILGNLRVSTECQISAMDVRPDGPRPRVEVHEPCSVPKAEFNGLPSCSKLV